MIAATPREIAELAVSNYNERVDSIPEDYYDAVQQLLGELQDDLSIIIDVLNRTPVDDNGLIKYYSDIYDYLDAFPQNFIELEELVCDCIKLLKLDDLI